MIRSAERNADLRRIHGTARKLGLSEFGRRALQYEVTGRESCLEMTAEERAAVIQEMAVVKMQPAPSEVVTDAEALEILGY